MVVDKQTKVALKAFKALVEPIVKRIAKERDALRRVVDEYQEMLESVECASDDFQAALDTISQYL